MNQMINYYLELLWLYSNSEIHDEMISLGVNFEMPF